MAERQTTNSRCKCGGEWHYENIGGMGVYRTERRKGRNVSVYRVRCSACMKSSEVTR